MDSAKARLALCVQDTADEFQKDRSNSGVSSQLGAVLGMLGDCWYVTTVVSVEILWGLVLLLNLHGLCRLSFF